MNQVTISDLRRISVEKLREMIPCLVTCDGEVVATLLDHDPKRDALRLVPSVSSGELPFSRNRQADRKGFNA